jgi:hypothetical protein
MNVVDVIGDTTITNYFSDTDGFTTSPGENVTTAPDVLRVSGLGRSTKLIKRSIPENKNTRAIYASTNTAT